MNKNDPYPWKAKTTISGNFMLVCDKNGSHVAGPLYPDTALLIAEAPNMLKILKRLEKKYGCNGDGWPNKEFDDVRKVISKATGKG